MKKSLLLCLPILLFVAGCVNKFTASGSAFVSNTENISLVDTNEAPVLLQSGDFNATVTFSEHAKLELTLAKQHHTFSLSNFHYDPETEWFSGEIKANTPDGVLLVYGYVVTKQLRQGTIIETSLCNPDAYAQQKPRLHGTKQIEEQVVTYENHREIIFTMRAGSSKQPLATLVSPTYKTSKTFRLRDLSSCQY